VGLSPEQFTQAQARADQLKRSTTPAKGQVATASDARPVPIK
jgi:hypothetical protein